MPLDAKTSNDKKAFKSVGTSPIRPDGIDKVTGRVTYSQEILKEFGWIDEAAGLGVDTPGTGYSRL